MFSNLIIACRQVTYLPIRHTNCMKNYKIKAFFLKKNHFYQQKQGGTVLLLLLVIIRNQLFYDDFRLSCQVNFVAS